MSSAPVKPTRRITLSVTCRLPLEYWNRLVKTAETEKIPVGTLTASIIKFVIDRELTPDEFDIIFSKKSRVIRKPFEFKQLKTATGGGAA